MDASKKPVLVNRGDADNVARIFTRHPHIHGVELFGSVARDGVGRDLDLILVTDERHGTEFVEEVRARLDDFSLIGRDDFLEADDSNEMPGEKDPEDVFQMRCICNRPSIRMDAAGILGGNFHELLAEARRYTALFVATQLDIFVFPPDWRKRLDELQDALPNKDPNFMANIARDAVKIA